MSSPEEPNATTEWKRRKDRLGPRLVSCIVSPRWLEFRDVALYSSADEDYILGFDVMTHGEGERPRKLCELMVPQKELEAAIRAVEHRERRQRDFAPPEDVVLNADGISTNVPRIAEVGFSSHFTWGYVGSGPHDLAFNILLWSGLEMERARFLYRKFTKDFLVSRHFTKTKAARIGRDKIAAWIRAQPAGLGEPK